jgi:hypothetical protein
MTFLVSNGVQSYARAVREAMADLPPEQAHEVLDGLDEHLAEIVAEGTTDLEGVLGSPESYADELRASAGLPASTRRTSWAAPPAAHRFGEPASDAANEALDPQAQPRSAGRLAPAVRRELSMPGVALCRIFLGLVFGSLLVGLIRASRPLNIFHVVFGTLLIVGAWHLLRAASTRAELPAAWKTHAPRVLAGTAIVLALILGSRMGSSGDRTVFMDAMNAQPSTAFVGSTTGEIPVPNMIGTSLTETRETLIRFALNVVVEGGEPELGTRQITTRMDPAPGTLLQPGSVVRVVVSPVSSLLPTSVVTPTTLVPSAPIVTPTTTIQSVSVPTITPTTTSSTTITPPVSVPIATTGLSVGPGAGVTVPVVTTIGTTTVAAVPATAAPRPDQTASK